MSQSPTANLTRRLRSPSLFWIVNLAFWGVLCVAEQVLQRSPGPRQPRLVIVDVLVWVAGLLTALLLRLAYDRLDSQSTSIGKLALLVAGWSFVGVNAWFLLQILVNVLVFPREFELSAVYRTLTSMKYVQQAYVKEWPLLLWSAVYFLVKFWTEWQRAQARAAEAALLAERAQLEMLRYQLNPHFLFNALNSIRALVDENREATKQMITDLAEFLRYSLVHRDHDEVTLGEELDAIRDYTAIQKRRHEDRLEVRWKVDPAARSHGVPSFLIYPLVENAVKYGMLTSTLPLVLSIEAEATASELVIAVRNTGRWVEPAEGGASDQSGEVGREGRAAAEGRVGGEMARSGTGTGLENVRRRLRNAYPDRHRFEISEESGQVTVRLVICGTPVRRA